MSEKHIEPIRMYAHNACPQVPSVLSVLMQARAEYEYINIHNDMAARERVRDINNGYESVPTLVFPDGSTLTEPNAGELRDKLISMGYKVPITALITGNLGLMAIALGVTLALLRAFGVF